jgi:hypothetical protein
MLPGLMSSKWIPYARNAVRQVPRSQKSLASKSTATHSAIERCALGVESPLFENYPQAITFSCPVPLYFAASAFDVFMLVSWTFRVERAFLLNLLLRAEADSAA